MANVTYRGICPDDCDAVHDIAGYWEVVRELGSWPWPARRDFTLSRCQPYAGEGFVWAICKDDRAIGTVAVTGRTLGYMLHPDYWGAGIMTAACGAALDHARATSDMPYIEADAWADNAGSNRVLCKLGFRHLQTHYERSKARGLPTLSHYYRLSLADWHGLSKTAQ